MLYLPSVFDFLLELGMMCNDDKNSFTFSDRLNFNLFLEVLCMKGFEVRIVSDIFYLSIDYCASSIFIQ